MLKLRYELNKKYRIYHLVEQPNGETRLAGVTGFGNNMGTFGSLEEAKSALGNFDEEMRYWEFTILPVWYQKEVLYNDD